MLLRQEPSLSHLAYQSHSFGTLHGQRFWQNADSMLQESQML
jgi:hypothetical protein